MKNKKVIHIASALCFLAFNAVFTGLDVSAQIEKNETTVLNGIVSFSGVTDETDGKVTYLVKKENTSDEDFLSIGELNVNTDGSFTIDDVCDEVCKKLIYRHPHIFGDISVSGTDEVLSNWEELKRREKGQDTYADTLTAVAKSLPALIRAEKLQKRAKKCGFDWENVDGAYRKVEEELREVREAGPEDVLEEMGDLLFAVVNVSRFLKVNPEEALEYACKKFTNRFDLMERLAQDAGFNLAELDLDGMDKFWEAAKSVEKANGKV